MLQLEKGVLSISSHLKTNQFIVWGWGIHTIVCGAHRTTWRSQFFPFTPCGNLGNKLRLKAWLQALLPTEPSGQPQVTVGRQFKKTTIYQDTGLPICPLGHTQYSGFCYLSKMTTVLQESHPQLQQQRKGRLTSLDSTRKENLFFSNPSSYFPLA